MKYAKIIVSISHSNIDHIFHYRIPFNLKDKISLGMRVIVPFGKGNRKIEGYVTGFSNEANIENIHIKDIIDICEEYSIISPKRIELAKWMQTKYYTTLSNCIQCIIPKKVNEKNFACLTLNVDNINIQEDIEKIMKKDTKQRKVLNLLLNGDEVPISHIKTLLEVDDAPIYALIKKGIVKRVYEQVYRGNFNTASVKTTKSPVLTEEQAKTCNKIFKEMDNPVKKPILIHGVTGSGKTEIYLQVIDKALSQGKSAIVLVPEISLTQQTVERFVSRFGDKVSVTHSRLNDGERYDQWKRARLGEVSVMIGPRSAIFTPFENLGVIIIDEEHESTYKSDQLSPKYDTIEVAEKLSSLYDCTIVLGSATPSITSYYKAENNEYILCTLNNRVNNLYPKIKIVDMRAELTHKNFSIFSRELRSAIESNIKKGEQTILFLNRRGHSTFVSCRECGYVMTCNNCNVNYTYHKGINKLSCHYCGATTDVPETCPNCGSKYIKYFGTGTEKIEQEVNKVFPTARVLRMDLDTTQRKNSHQRIIDEFRNGKADILIGTQMIAKGLDFKNVTLVGIIAADLSLNVGDYKSAETTYQLVSQVAGRAGRADKEGRVYIQTYSPEHYSIQFAAKNDYIGFYNQEILYRKSMVYPPFTNIFVVMFVGKNEGYLQQCLFDLLYIMRYYNRNNLFSHLGPTPAVISKINNNYRWQLMVKCEDEDKLRNYVLFCLDKLKKNINLNNININLNLNPNFI